MTTSGAFGSYDVKQLFGMVDTANNQLSHTHDQIQAWQRAEQMLQTHYLNLVGYRNNLTAQWPPEQNAAAAVYLQHLDDLMDAVTKTADAVATNRGLLEQVATSIENQMKAHSPDGQPTLKQLHDEYVGNEQKLAVYQAQLNAAQTAGSTAGDVTGHVAGTVAGGGSSLLSDAFGAIGSTMLGDAAKAGMQLFTDPPVPNGRQDQLNRQARDTYARLGSTAQDAAANMQMPPPYQPPQLLRIDAGTHLGGTSTSSGTIQPPAIAPPAHTRTSDTPGVQVLGGTGTPTPPGAAPVLSGSPAGTVPTPGVGAGSDATAHAPGADVAAGVVLGLLPIAAAPAVSGGGRPSSRGGGIDKPGVETEELSRPAVKRALPPGGVIGEAEPGLGAIERSASGIRRVNPVGGVIGEAEPGLGAGGRSVAGRVASTGGAGASGEVEPGVFGGQRGGSRADDAERPWDPDNPWQVVDGVAPVIVPGEAPRAHDAGPAVIGIDR